MWSNESLKQFFNNKFLQQLSTAGGVSHFCFQIGLNWDWVKFFCIPHKSFPHLLLFLILVVEPERQLFALPEVVLDVDVDGLLIQ